MNKIILFHHSGGVTKTKKTKTRRVRSQRRKRRIWRVQFGPKRVYLASPLSCTDMLCLDNIFLIFIKDLLLIYLFLYFIQDITRKVRCKRRTCSTHSPLYTTQTSQNQTKPNQGVPYLLCRSSTTTTTTDLVKSRSAQPLPYTPLCFISLTYYGFHSLFLYFESIIFFFLFSF